MEQVMGIEPTASAWKAEVLPLYDTCGVIKGKCPKHPLLIFHKLELKALALELTILDCMLSSGIKKNSRLS
jgi:hypothetical protein